MEYSLKTPCKDCPFLDKKNMRETFSIDRLEEFASSEFPCHKTATTESDDDGIEEFVETEGSVHCAGALIYLEKRERPHQMMRICERLGMYDRSQLDMKAKVR